jgi:hypothetical protein
MTKAKIPVGVNIYFTCGVASNLSLPKNRVLYTQLQAQHGSTGTLWPFRHMAERLSHPHGGWRLDQKSMGNIKFVQCRLWNEGFHLPEGD